MIGLTSWAAFYHLRTENPFFRLMCWLAGKENRFSTAGGKSADKDLSGRRIWVVPAATLDIPQQSRSSQNGSRSDAAKGSRLFSLTLGLAPRSMVSVVHVFVGLALLLAAWSLRSEVEPLFAGGELADPEALRWATSGKYYNFQGHAIFYKVREAAAQASTGAGAAKPPTIVFLHGFPTNSFDFLPLWQGLPEKYRLVALDLLSFGLSDKPGTLTRQKSALTVLSH
jgi:hypothetical protein